MEPSKVVKEYKGEPKGNERLTTLVGESDGRKGVARKKN
ncbi:hypothetical protein MNB_SUP05-SYMBIONT-4-575 [hydrothermal vent metagenome]|uniref:Uncharacterized protein n=1 Tax=hydrothermal vent metagenome TaxID=652676 RepID=A0A1W1DVF9_9ZZZZ